MRLNLCAISAHFPLRKWARPGGVYGSLDLIYCLHHSFGTLEEKKLMGQEHEARSQLHQTVSVTRFLICHFQLLGMVKVF